MQHIRELMTDDCTDYVAAKYKAASTACVTQLVLQSSMKPQHAS